MLINACHKDNEHLQSEIEKLKKLSFKKEMVETSKEYLKNSSVNSFVTEPIYKKPVYNGTHL